jgi:hypothetical protein
LSNAAGSTGNNALGLQLETPSTSGSGSGSLSGSLGMGSGATTPRNRSLSAVDLGNIVGFPSVPPSPVVGPGEGLGLGLGHHNLSGMELSASTSTIVPAGRAPGAIGVPLVSGTPGGLIISPTSSAVISPTLYAQASRSSQASPYGQQQRPRPERSETLIIPALLSHLNEQNAQDASKDLQDLRSLLREAINLSGGQTAPYADSTSATSSYVHLAAAAAAAGGPPVRAADMDGGADAAMMDLLGVRRDEIGEAVKTLQRALERVVERENAINNLPVTVSHSQVQGAGAGVGVERIEEEDAEGEVDMTPRKGAGGGRLTKMVRRLSQQASIPTASPPKTSASIPVSSSPKGGAAGVKRSSTVSSKTSSSHSASGSGSGSGHSNPSNKPPIRDTLDREFIESGIDALRRLSKSSSSASSPADGTPSRGLKSLPSWTITRYEIDRDVKIGVGFFSNVYRGTWTPPGVPPPSFLQNTSSSTAIQPSSSGQIIPGVPMTVAIKVLAETTPRKLFVREVEIWKKLRHPNVLELYGASSAQGDPPWFFVSAYVRRGSLSEFLRRLEGSVVVPSTSTATVVVSDRQRTGSLPNTYSHHRNRSGHGHSHAAVHPHHHSAVHSSPLAHSHSAHSAHSHSHSHSVQSHGRTRTRSGSTSSTIHAASQGQGQGDQGEMEGKEWNLLRYMHEIAKGMEYLHSNGVLHGDLKVCSFLFTS